MIKRNSRNVRTPGEVFRDDVLQGYPEWPRWSRKLRRIFISLPSYGVGEDALESMCEDFEWDFPKTKDLIKKNPSFSSAVDEFIENEFEYRTTEFVTRSGKMFKYKVKWSALQKVYMLESGITSFIKAETGKVSTAENKLIEKAGLLDIDPMVLGSDHGKEEKSKSTVDISGESRLSELESSLHGT